VVVRDDDVLAEAGDGVVAAPKVCDPGNRAEARRSRTKRMAFGCTHPQDVVVPRALPPL